MEIKQRKFTMLYFNFPIFYSFDLRLKERMAEKDENGTIWTE